LIIYLKENSTQQIIYDETAFPLVESVLEGYNGTIFAYGQTGCGKTFTMEGKRNPNDMRGIIPNAFNHIFGFIDQKEESMQYLIRIA
jgi:kinesin family protein 3/17